MYCNIRETFRLGRLAALAAVVGVIASSVPSAQSWAASVKATSVAADSTRIILRIGKLYVSNRSILDTIPITLESFGEPIAALDLKIGVDNPSIQITDILPGEICDSCGWSYFHARKLETGGARGYPQSLWQAVAMAQGLGDTTKPKCYGFDRAASLLRLVVASAPTAHLRDTNAPIFFLWEKCADNVLSGPSGDELYMSLNVIDYYPIALAEPNDVFPTRHGAPRQCVSPAAKNRPKRVIEFCNGGVRIRHGVDSLQAPPATPGVPPGTPFSPDSAGNSPR